MMIQNKMKLLAQLSDFYHLLKHIGISQWEINPANKANKANKYL